MLLGAVEMKFSKACITSWRNSFDFVKLLLRTNGISYGGCVLTVQCKRMSSDRDLRLYGVINELASGYGNFCTECKSRKVNETCYNCLKMFREKVRVKCDDVKAYRSHNPLF